MEYDVDIDEVLDSDVLDEDSIVLSPSSSTSTRQRLPNEEQPRDAAMLRKRFQRFVRAKDMEAVQHGVLAECAPGCLAVCFGRFCLHGTL